MLTSKLSNAIRLAISTGFVSSVLLYAPTSSAEEETEAKKDLEVISVTGSRIRQPGAVSASPIVSIGEQVGIPIGPENRISCMMIIPLHSPNLGN